MSNHTRYVPRTDTWVVVHRTDGEPDLIVGPFASIEQQIAFEPNVPHDMVSLHATLLEACAEQQRSWEFKCEAVRNAR